MCCHSLSFPLNSSSIFLGFFFPICRKQLQPFILLINPVSCCLHLHCFFSMGDNKGTLNPDEVSPLPRPFSVSARNKSAIPKRHFFLYIYHSKSNDNTEKSNHKWITYLSSNLIDLLLAQSSLPPFQAILCQCYNCYADQQLPRIIFSSCILTSLACSIVFCKSKKVSSVFYKIYLV